MILKRRALKAYQEQLSKYPLQKPKPINLPVVESKHNNFDHNFNAESQNAYSKWYMIDDNKPKKENSNYNRYRNLAVLDIGLKISFGLILIGLIINLVLF